MSKIDDGGPAFPIASDTHPHYHGYTGMSKRDWFAGQALAGLCAANATYLGRTDRHDLLAADAYRVADAMIAARAKGGAA